MALVRVSTRARIHYSQIQSLDIPYKHIKLWNYISFRTKVGIFIDKAIDAFSRLCFISVVDLSCAGAWIGWNYKELHLLCS